MERAGKAGGGGEGGGEGERYRGRLARGGSRHTTAGGAAHAWATGRCLCLGLQCIAGGWPLDCERHHLISPEQDQPQHPALLSLRT